MLMLKFCWWVGCCGEDFVGWFDPGKMAKAFEDGVKRMCHDSIYHVVKT
ncbi:hypothetical protein [Candidatus Nitrospira salsa]